MFRAASPPSDTTTINPVMVTFFKFILLEMLFLDSGMSVVAINLMENVTADATLFYILPNYDLNKTLHIFQKISYHTKSQYYILSCSCLTSTSEVRTSSVFHYYYYFLEVKN